MALVYLGLGTNLGDREKNLQKAKSMLFKYSITPVKESSIEETEPVDFLEQPEFLNQVILVETDIEPLGLLKTIKKIEKDMGRNTTINKGPRIIDIDILLYDDSIINTEVLVVPHPAIKQRDFVLRHLLEIDHDLEDPAAKIKYLEVYKCQG